MAFTAGEVHHPGFTPVANGHAVPALFPWKSAYLALGRVGT